MTVIRLGNYFTITNLFGASLLVPVKEAEELRDTLNQMLPYFNRATETEREVHE